VRWNLAFAALALCWGVISLIAADVRLSAPVLVFDRVVLAAMTVGLVAVASGRAHLLAVREERGRLAVTSVALAVHWLTFFAAIKLASIAVGNLTTYTAPILVALVAPLVLPERRSFVAALAIIPAGAGLAFIALAGGDAHATASGIAVGLLSAVSLAALIILTKQLSSLHPVGVLFWSYLAVAAVMAPVLPFAGRFLPDGRELGLVLLLGVVFTALSGLLYYGLMRRVTAQGAGPLMYLEPVSAAFLGWILLGQELGWQVLVGGALVLLGGLLIVVFEPADAGTVQP